VPSIARLELANSPHLERTFANICAHSEAVHALQEMLGNEIPASGVSSDDLDRPIQQHSVLGRVVLVASAILDEVLVGHQVDPTCGVDVQLDDLPAFQVESLAIRVPGPCAQCPNPAGKQFCKPLIVTAWITGLSGGLGILLFVVNAASVLSTAYLVLEECGK
jgi:hypothetical protein